MLVHLYNASTRLTPADVQDQDAAMKQPYNANKLMESLFYQIGKAINLVAAAAAA
jgi:hypothetical protein